MGGTSATLQVEYEMIMRMARSGSVLSFIALVIVAFFLTAATGSVVTVEALFVKHNLRGSFLELGFIFSLAALVYAIIAPVIGRLADRYGKAKFLTIKLLLMGLLAISTLFMTATVHYLPVKVFITLVSPMAFLLVTALLMDMVGGAKHEGKYFSLFYISPALGGSLGSFVAGILGVRFGLSSAFVFSAVLFFLAAVFAAFLISEEHGQPLLERRPSLNPIPSFRRIIKTPELVVLLLLSVVFSLHWVTRDIIYPFFLEDVGKTVADLGNVFSSMGVAAAVMMLFGGEIIDRFGSRKALLIAFGLMSVSALLIPSTSVFTLFWAFNLPYAMGEALFAPTSLKVIAELIEKGHRAEVTASMSSFTTVIGVAWPLILGSLMEGSAFTSRNIILIAGIVVSAGAIVSTVMMVKIHARFDRVTISARIRGYFDNLLK